jgi:hypothetical protein
MFFISFKFPARSERVEHCFLWRTLDRASYQSYCPNISCKTAGLAETSSNIEVHSVIRCLRLKGTSPAEIHRQLVEVYGASFMSRKHVWVWCTAFENGKPHTWVVTALQLGGTGPILPTALTWHRVIFISLDHLRSTWVEGDSRPTAKFSKPSCPGFRRLTLISSMLGIMWGSGGAYRSTWQRYVEIGENLLKLCKVTFLTNSHCGTI